MRSTAACRGFRVDAAADRDEDVACQHGRIRLPSEWKGLPDAHRLPLWRNPDNMRGRFRQTPHFSGVFQIMPSGNVPSGTLDAGLARPHVRETDLTHQPTARLRQSGQGGPATKRWYRLSFRTQLALVCLQVFVLLAAGFGLLVSAQHKRAQGHRRDVPARFESADLGTPAAPDSAETALVATTETIRGQSPQAGLSEIDDSDTADSRSDTAELQVVELEALSAAAERATAAYNSAAQKPQADPASDPSPAPAESAAAAPFKNLVMSQPRASVTGGGLGSSVAPRSTRRTTRIVNSVQQPAATDSRHRTAVRKRRWESAADRRAAGRGESLPLPSGR
jgi:hypothetical protein